MDQLCYLCLVSAILPRLFIAALWSPVGKGLTSWLLFVMSKREIVTFPCGFLGQVWYLIALIPDLCRLSNFKVVLVPCDNISCILEFIKLVVKKL